MSLASIKDSSKTSNALMMTRRKGVKKHSLQRVNEHFEPIFNAVSTSPSNFQRYP